MASRAVCKCSVPVHPCSLNTVTTQGDYHIVHKAEMGELEGVCIFQGVYNLYVGRRRNMYGSNNTLCNCIMSTNRLVFLPLGILYHSEHIYKCFYIQILGEVWKVNYTHLLIINISFFFCIPGPSLHWMFYYLFLYVLSPLLKCHMALQDCGGGSICLLHNDNHLFYIFAPH